MHSLTSDTPATAPVHGQFCLSSLACAYDVYRPAANWYANGKGLSDDIFADNDSEPRQPSREVGEKEVAGRVYLVVVLCKGRASASRSELGGISDTLVKETLTLGRHAGDLFGIGRREEEISDLPIHAISIVGGRCYSAATDQITYENPDLHICIFAVSCALPVCTYADIGRFVACARVLDENNRINFQIAMHVVYIYLPVCLNGITSTRRATCASCNWTNFTANSRSCIPQIITPAPRGSSHSLPLAIAIQKL